MLRSDRVWRVLLAASRALRSRADALPRRFSLSADGRLAETAAEDPSGWLAWRAEDGWTLRDSPAEVEDSRFSLYLPLCAARAGHPVVVGHLGQSLDGFVATLSGDSRFVNCGENILHLHRLRALCDAVIVGASTVAADDPQLTTRLVDGPNPLRVVLDPRRRLGPSYRLFNDGAAQTIVVCDAGLAAPGERLGQAEVVGVPARSGRLDLDAVLRLLEGRACHAVFVEGGGVTVSSFLEAGLLDRLHVTVAPLVIGEGRPGLRLPPAGRLVDALRPAHRIFRVGDDMLFDCDLRAVAADGEASGLERVL
jgi:riboflavin-specific deaminase-like protein